MTDREFLTKIQTVLDDFIDDGSSTAGDIIDLRKELDLHLYSPEPESRRHSGAVNQFDPS